MKIKKVLNSSVVLVTDETAKEYVLLGKGIGYGKKTGNPVEMNRADQVFMPVDSFKAKELLGLIDSMPPEIVEITQRIVSRAEASLGTKLNTGVYFTLMDHLNFAYERYQKGIVITNKVFWEIKNFYAKEFEIGMQAVACMDKAFDIEFPKEEAANIAFHLVNAQGDETVSKDGMKYAKMIGAIVNLVRYSLNITMDMEDVHYMRFITHVKFFVERFFDNAMLHEDRSLFNHISSLYPEAIVVANKIRDYISQVHDRSISQEEIAYLAIHIHRLSNYNQL